MKVLIVAILLVCSQALFNNINSEIVNTIKEKTTTWTPYEVDENPLLSRSSFEVLSMFGSKGSTPDAARNFQHELVKDIPESFNAADQWPDCILPIQDQELCGADWALNAVEVLSERMCISTNSSQNFLLSVNDILSCDEKDWGCSGGFPDRAWDFMTDEGVVTEACVPFDAKDGHRTQCSYNKCTSDDDVEYKKYYSTPLKYFTGEKTIQTEIMTNGPVQTEFQVYSDFLNYKKGIYQHTTGGKLGFYSAKIVGWGTENNTPYWLAASTFGENWAENGYFRILRGNNECNFENSAIAGDLDTWRL